MRPLFLFAMMLAMPALAQNEEDAAHRADRLRTEQLNRNAAAVVARRDGGNAAGQADYRAARARYEKQMAEWRARVRACEQGDWRACN